MEKSDFLITAEKTAKAAGQLVLKKFGEKQPIQLKPSEGSISFVTEADLTSEKLILETIIEKFPDHSFFSEEVGSEENDSDYLWIIDPLDGTTNFSVGSPHFGISIALSYKKEVILGCVYVPVLDELFTAEKGKGSFLNGKPISVLERKDLSKTTSLMYRQTSKEQNERFKKIANILISNTKSYRMWGATEVDLCYLACGRLDILTNNGCEIYNFAAGSIICTEAGAIVSDFKGNPLKLETTDVLATNKHLHPELVQLLGEV
jgi:myo-inositol-1(or 4)-monophosphatase